MKERIGHYRILRELGRGGMGIVYAAIDEHLHREVAIKEMREAAVSDDAARRRFCREARAAARVRHPNVCQIYEIGEEDERPFLALELLDGQSLAKRLEEGPMSVPEAVDTALDVLSALEALHEQGIIHRDLKPSNVFLSSHGVKILDFGLASELKPVEVDSQRVTESRLTEVGMIVGTPQYMAPRAVSRQVQ